MKQVLVRPIAGAPGVLELCFGDIKDGHFVPDLPVDPNDLLWITVQFDNLLGVQAYLRSADFTDFLRDVIKAGSTVAYNPQFIVITLPEDEPKEKEN